MVILSGIIPRNKIPGPVFSKIHFENINPEHYFTRWNSKKDY